MPSGWPSTCSVPTGRARQHSALSSLPQMNVPSLKLMLAAGAPAYLSCNHTLKIMPSLLNSVPSPLPWCHKCQLNAWRCCCRKGLHRLLQDLSIAKTSLQLYPLPTPEQPFKLQLFWDEVGRAADTRPSRHLLKEVQCMTCSSSPYAAYRCLTI